MTKFVLRLAWTIVYTILISGAGILFADCPEGARPTTEAEQQSYLTRIQALKTSLPNAPEGWELQQVKTFTSAPTSVCKGLKPVAAIDATYISVSDRKLNDERSRQYDARIEALRKLSPEEQKEADTLYHQGSDLGYKSIAELKNKNQAEADRLRAEANKAYAASKAIQQVHLEKVFPQMRAIEDEKRAAYVNPEVHVHILVRDLAQDHKTVKTEPAHIEGIANPTTRRTRPSRYRWDLPRMGSRSGRRSRAIASKPKPSRGSSGAREPKARWRVVSSKES
ncbi:MAG TPA: hypothetical protein VN753_11265 [Terracidiphilus sp.]|nr:hypothetical protein [Terracidiphilus sp.]